ncbi:hypothetical protein AYI70_g11263 [Smittium culicis]|uniref:Uncharacterized protein n=1 Tax=Smittium culicis TaxID=133412 RepID=A0A1R1X2L7_9FUNG|nr:hypothetical protein AYI70_g11263 [Smittium culicis]
MTTDPQGKEIPPNWGKGGIKSRVFNKVSLRSISVNLTKKEEKEDNEGIEENLYEGLQDDNCEVISCKNFKNIIDLLATKRTSNDVIRIDENLSNKKQKIDLSVIDSRSLEYVPLIDRINKIKNQEDELIEINEFDKIGYKMKANIVNKNLSSNLVKKCKELKIEMTLEELASVSPLIRKSLNDEFKVKRIDKVSNINNSINQKLEDWKRAYLSVGSGRKIGVIQGAEVEILLDEGSEINIMSSAVYNSLESLGRANLNTNIKWQMKDANSGVSSLLGVVENCFVIVERCRVKVPIFVSNSIKESVILGRPLDLKCRALKDNRQDGSLWYTIKDEFDGGRFNLLRQ